MGIGTTNPTSTDINAHLENHNTQVLAVGIVTAKEYYGDGSKLDNVGGQITVENSGTVVSSSVTSINFSDNLTATAQAGFCTVTASGGGGATEVDTEVSTTAATGVGSFGVFTHQSAAVIAQINQGAGNVQIGRYLIIHDGFVGSASTTATIVEESSVSTTDAQLGSYTVRIEQGNCEMMVNMVSSGIATITTKIDTVTV